MLTAAEAEGVVGGETCFGSRSIVDGTSTGRVGLKCFRDPGAMIKVRRYGNKVRMYPWGAVYTVQSRFSKGFSGPHSQWNGLKSKISSSLGTHEQCRIEVSWSVHPAE